LWLLAAAVSWTWPSLDYLSEKKELCKVIDDQPPKEDKDPFGGQVKAS
jgi:hypothetical protein